MKIYLDACCLSRLTDDQRQMRVRDEAEAIERILSKVRNGLLKWVSSTVLNLEISRNPDPERRRDAEALVAFANEVLAPSSSTADLAARIQDLGIGSFDALHVAIADESGVDVFLTTDDDLLRRSRRNQGLFRVRVENPVSWLREVQS